MAESYPYFLRSPGFLATAGSTDFDFPMESPAMTRREIRETRSWSYSQGGPKVDEPRDKGVRQLGTPSSDASPRIRACHPRYQAQR